MNDRITGCAIATYDDIAARDASQFTLEIVQSPDPNFPDDACYRHIFTGKPVADHVAQVVAFDVQRLAPYTLAKVNTDRVSISLVVQ